MGRSRELAELAASYDSGNLFGMKNRIINGAMMIDQRNAGALVAGATGNIYGVDRTAVGVFGSGTGRISAQQSSTAPTGFTNSLVGTVTTADASPSTYYGYCVAQRIEGYNVADLGFGASGAATVTASFWVRSSIAGTYVLTFQNENADRSYSATYTINAANTWEYKTITVPGDTTGTWYKTTNAGLILYWGLGGGSGRQAPSLNAWSSGVAGGYAITDASGCVDWIATNGATFYITGVQLEKGSTATSFEYRPYGTELALCQRYYWSGCNFPGAWASTSQIQVIAQNPVQMRATPTVAATGTIYAWNPIGADVAVSALAATTNQTTFHSKLTCSTSAAGGLSTGMGGWTYPNTNGTFTFSAEL